MKYVLAFILVCLIAPCFSEDWEYYFYDPNTSQCQQIQANTCVKCTTSVESFEMTCNPDVPVLAPLTPCMMKEYYRNSVCSEYASANSVPVEDLTSLYNLSSQEEICNFFAQVNNPQDCIYGAIQASSSHLGVIIGIVVAIVVVLGVIVVIVTIIGVYVYKKKKNAEKHLLIPQ